MLISISNELIDNFDSYSPWQTEKFRQERFVFFSFSSIVHSLPAKQKQNMRKGKKLGKERVINTSI